MIVNVVVEGRSDREAAIAVVRYAGHDVGKVIAKGGTPRLDPDIPKYNVAARWEPWVVFRDADADCPVTLRTSLVGNMRLEPSFALRFARSMTEAWLLADRERFASFLGVTASALPSDPEAVPHAKQTVLQLASTSRRTEIRRGLVSASGTPGPLYVELINRFARENWNVGAAVESSDTLRRAVDRIRDLAPVGDVL